MSDISGQMTGGAGPQQGQGGGNDMQVSLNKVIQYIAQLHGGQVPGQQGGGQGFGGQGQAAAPPMQGSSPNGMPPVGGQMPAMGGAPQSPNGYQYLGEAPSFAAGQSMMQGAQPGQGTAFSLPKGTYVPPGHMGGGQQPGQQAPQPGAGGGGMDPATQQLHQTFQGKGLDPQQAATAVQIYQQMMAKMGAQGIGLGGPGGM